jgi:hypothetical protein
LRFSVSAESQSSSFPSSAVLSRWIIAAKLRLENSHRVALRAPRCVRQKAYLSHPAVRTSSPTTDPA